MEKQHITRLDVIEASKKTLTRRDFLKLAGIMAGSAVVAAATPGVVMASPLPAHAPEPVTLDVWWSSNIHDLNEVWDPTDPNNVPFQNEWWWGGLARLAFLPWLSRHQGVSLNITNHNWADPLRANQLTAIASGKAPDTTYGESFVSEFARMDIYKPVSSKSAGLFPHGPMAEACLGDKYYGIPQNSGTFALMINLDAIERCGLPTDRAHLPTTWDQLLADAQKVSQNNLVGFPFPDFWGPFSDWGGIGDWSHNAYFCYPPLTPAEGGNYGIPMRVLPWFDQNRAPLTDEDGDPSVNSKRAVDTWVWFNALMSTSKIALSTDFGKYWGDFAGGALFHYGVTPYRLGWSNDMMFEGNPANNFGDNSYVNSVAVPMPLPPGGMPANVVVGNQINSAFKRSRHADLALNLVEEVWTREDVHAYMPQNVGTWIPALKSLLNQWRTYDKLDAYGTDAAKDMVRLTMRALLDNGVDSMPKWPNNTTECWGDWLTSFQTIWEGNLSRDGIKTEMDNLQKKLRADIHSPQTW
jgi:ABC-type glycerol-3-phosphate transport system substrate-binding protein